MLGSKSSGSQARDRTRSAGHTRQATAQAAPQRKGMTSDVVFLELETRAPMMADQLPRMMRADSPPNARLMVQRAASIMARCLGWSFEVSRTGLSIQPVEGGRSIE